MSELRTYDPRNVAISFAGKTYHGFTDDKFTVKSELLARSDSDDAQSVDWHAALVKAGAEVPEKLALAIRGTPKTPDQIIADVQSMLDDIREQTTQRLHPPHFCLSLAMLRGEAKRFRNRAARKAWAQGLQRLFASFDTPVKAPLGQWTRFMRGEPLPKSSTKVAYYPLLNARKAGLDV